MMEDLKDTVISYFVDFVDTATEEESVDIPFPSPHIEFMMEPGKQI